MNRLARALIALSLLTASGCPQQPAKPTPAKTCREDDACWNCETMGDRKCGPVTNDQGVAV